jgi:hypothetical protein
MSQVRDDRAPAPPSLWLVLGSGSPLSPAARFDRPDRKPAAKMPAAGPVPRQVSGRACTVRPATDVVMRGMRARRLPASAADKAAPQSVPARICSRNDVTATPHNYAVLPSATRARTQTSMTASASSTQLVDDRDALVPCIGGWMTQDMRCLGPSHVFVLAVVLGIAQARRGVDHEHAVHLAGSYRLGALRAPHDPYLQATSPCAQRTGSATMTHPSHTSLIQQDARGDDPGISEHRFALDTGVPASPGQGSESR